ncbi:tyrosine-protein phosphatase [Streptomyces sp. NPDC093589]|uniref:tyrosine-protein phosphatase n=1 Tax=Streptomyces sp. NPDC093589 TaxID=3366043 RepID=UPI003806330F
MPTEPRTEAGATDRAWPVLPQVYAANCRTAEWAVPDRPTTVFCLSRTLPGPDVYDRARAPLSGVLHRPFTYWESADPVTLLDRLVQEISDCATREQTVVHCTLGLDRTGVVALALLLRDASGLGDALRRYQARGVRLPREDAMDVLTRYAHGEPWTARKEAGHAH